MSRIAKPESFLLLSPSKQDVSPIIRTASAFHVLQVGKQNAAECMPLIMEPLSAFYSSPLLVLDFQSLYPSVMIAYNYCYSTCLGRVVEFKGQNKFGVTELSQQPGLLKTLQDHITSMCLITCHAVDRPACTVAPNGIMYVKKDVRRGLLGRMLAELLETRVMVKQAMKRVQGDKVSLRLSRLTN
jgi:DNA polymerase zeta